MAQQLTIDQKIMAEAAQAQLSYIYMHERVYLRKSCLIAQRFLQQIIARHIEESGTGARNALQRMTDGELDTMLQLSRSADVRTLFDRLQRRELPKMAFRLIPHGTVTHDRLDGKDIATREVELPDLHLFDRFRHPAAATKIEAGIADLLGIPAYAVLIVPTATPERFIPENVPVSDGTRITSLQTLRPGHYESLAETARTYASVRVCTFAEYRMQMAEYRNAERIVVLLMSAVEKN
jgi:hypothetical protein